MTRNERTAHNRRSRTISGLVQQMRVAQLDAGVYGYPDAITRINNGGFVYHNPGPASVERQPWNFGVWAARLT